MQPFIPWRVVVCVSPGAHFMTIDRNTLYAIIGVLILGCAALACSLHEEQQKPSGLNISIGGRRISVDTK